MEAARAEAAAAVLEAMREARAGREQRAQVILQNGVINARKAAKRSNNQALDQQADKLEELQQAVPEMARRQQLKKEVALEKNRALYESVQQLQ